MAPARFAQTRKSTFYGEYIYDQVVPKDHFFRKLNELLDWPTYSQKMMRWYKGGGEYGRPPFDPVVLLKMLLVAYLYNLSERQTESYINDSMSAKYFLGLGMDQAAPDHSTLTKFKERIVQRQRMMKLEQLLADIVQTALRTGIRFGSIQVVDSTHSLARVNTAKEGQREKQRKAPTDPDAQWGCKGKYTVRGSGGKKIMRGKYFFGYKAHVSMNSDNHLITSVITTPGHAFDGHYLQPLIEADLNKQVPVEMVAADRGYDDSLNHSWLERTGIQSAICLNDYRTQKKDANKEIWLELQANPAYQAGLKERYKIERKFGEAKQQHGLGRCRYIGEERYRVQALLMAMTLNLKRMVKLLYGVNFKNPVPVMA